MRRRFRGLFRIEKRQQFIGKKVVNNGFERIVILFFLLLFRSMLIQRGKQKIEIGFSYRHKFCETVELREGLKRNSVEVGNKVLGAYGRFHG